MYEPQFTVGSGVSKAYRNSYIDPQLGAIGCMPYNLPHDDLFWDVSRNDLVESKGSGDTLYENAFANMPQTYDIILSKVIEDVENIRYKFLLFVKEHPVDFDEIDSKLSHIRYDRLASYNTMKLFAEKYKLTVSVLEMYYSYYDIIKFYKIHKDTIEHLRLYPADITLIGQAFLNDISLMFNAYGHDVFTSVFFRCRSFFKFLSRQEYELRPEMIDKKCHSVINILQEGSWIYYIWQGSPDKEIRPSPDMGKWMYVFDASDFVKTHEFCKNLVSNNVTNYIKVSSSYGVKMFGKNTGVCCFYANSDSDVISRIGMCMVSSGFVTKDDIKSVTFRYSDETKVLNLNDITKNI